MKKNLRTLLVLALALCMVFALAACGGGDEEEYVEEEVAEDGEYVFALADLDGMTFQTATLGGAPIEDLCEQNGLAVEEVRTYWTIEGTEITIQLMDEAETSEIVETETGFMIGDREVVFDAENGVLLYNDMSSGEPIPVVMVPVE